MQRVKLLLNMILCGNNPTLFLMELNKMRIPSEVEIECGCVCCVCELDESTQVYEHGPASPCQHCVYLTDGHHCDNV